LSSYTYSATSIDFAVKYRELPHHSSPVSLNRSLAIAGKLQVTLRDSNGTSNVEEFDTVFFATGRTPDLSGLNLAAAGVQVNPANGKIPVVHEQTNVPNIFAVGDIVEGKQELTPVAVRAGELLARRLFGGSSVQMDYDHVATTVFTPFEYGAVGLSEEEAIARYGDDDVEVYCFEFTTLELSAMHRIKHPRHGEDVDMGHCCLSKLVCLKSQVRGAKYRRYCRRVLNGSSCTGSGK
jgi:thioredoxin reductase (NADPH)